MLARVTASRAAVASWQVCSFHGRAGGCRSYAALAAPGRRRQQALNRRTSPFDLPIERPPGEKYALPSATDTTLASEAEQRSATIRLDEITAEDVAAQWPPAPLVAEAVVPERVLPVKRPHLWLTDETTVGIDDVGRFVKIPRDDLIQSLPEGACGELARDLTLIPSRTRPVGLMLRKLTVELIHQLSEARDAVDSAGEFRIRKNGFLIDGHKGVGKSQVLNLLAMWARRNGWLVVMEPVPSRYSREIADIKRSNNGVYIQNEFSRQFLEAMSIANRQMLEEIPVNIAAYGSRAIDGEPVGETRKQYDPLIEKTVDQEADSSGPDFSGVDRLRRIAEYKRRVQLPSMTRHLSAPLNVWDIVEFGLENEAYATQAVAEVFVQLQRQTVHPVLVIVDEWNECFPCSQYVSVRYDNTRFYGHIPAYHLTMPRALHRWDGHRYRRGLKICATSWLRYKRRDYRPELLGVKEHELRTVRNFSQREFANYVTYLRLMGVLHNFPREDLEYYYMMTQGNGWQSRRLLTTLY